MFGVSKILGIVIRNLKWLYHKNHKISDTWKFAVITLNVEQDDFFE